MIDKMMAGIRKEEIKPTSLKSLADLVDMDYPFIVDPMPNLYFTRDPFSTIGNGVALNKMRTITRCRETIFSKYIFKYHKDYNVEILDISIHERSIMNVVVSGKMSDLILLNKKCEEETYGDIDID